MEILFADRIDERALFDLRNDGHTCVVEASLTADQLPQHIDGFDVLVVRSTRVDDDTIAAARTLMLIIRAGAGTNTIDVEAAAAAGIFVANVPGANSVAVAELTMGLLIGLDRQIPENVTDLRAGRWDKARYSKAEGLMGRRLGILGLGGIGLAVAERASVFGLELQGVQKPGRSTSALERIEALGIHLVDQLEELVATSDIVSIHVPSTPETVGMFDASLLGHMKPGSILLNTSRADIVDPDALLEALDAGRLRAGLDVFPDEPSTGRTEWASRLAQHPNVLGTHHIGASTAQAQRTIRRGVVEIIDRFQHGELINCVNLVPEPLGTSTLHIRHLDRVGVLAGVLDQLRRRNVNVEQMENRILAGCNAAVATMNVAGSIDEELKTALLSVPDVLHVTSVDREGDAR